MYRIGDYWKMMADHVRRDAYAEALRRAVKPGAVVANIGAGTGIFALLACRFGAARVYAIENDDIIELAKDLAAENGFGDRIEFIKAISTDVTLPEPADVVVSDLRGVLPLLGQHLPSIIDARQRLLARGGSLIPMRDTLWAGLVDVPDLYRHLVEPWGQNPYGFDFDGARMLSANRWSKVRVTPDQMLAEPQSWTTLKYDMTETVNAQGSLSWVVGRPGTAHGVCVWFESTLVDGVSLSAAPGHPELVYGSGFFPWSHPVPVARGDVVAVEISADLVGAEYVWSWGSRVHEGGSGGTLKAEFHQSSFFASPISKAELRRGSPHSVPTLNDDGYVDHAILSLMAEGLDLGGIAKKISERFSARFQGQQDALRRVQQLARRYDT